MIYNFLRNRIDASEQFMTSSYFRWKVSMDNNSYHKNDEN